MCPTDSPFGYKDKCVAKCPADAPKILQGHECVTHCSWHNASEWDGNCFYDCSTIQMHHFEDKCIKTCPDFTTLEGNEC